MSNWQKLCDSVNPLINKGVDEDLFHSLFESYLKNYFNWDDASVKHKVPVDMGSTKQADTVLAGNGFNIVIEMKKPDIDITSAHSGQLISYMRNLGDSYKYGLLIGNKIKVFYAYDRAKKASEIEAVASFDFNPDNPDGAAFGEILDKNICSNEKLLEYCKARIEKTQEKQRVQELKDALTANDGEKAKNLLKTGLLSEGHKEEIVGKALADIIVCFDTSVPIPPVDTGAIYMGSGTGKLELEFVPNNEKLFKARLLKTKQARRIWYYSNGKSETDIWNANNLGSDSNLRGNINSQSRVRNRNKNGLVKIKLEIIE